MANGLHFAMVVAMDMEELKNAREKCELQPWGSHWECPLGPGNDSGTDEGDTKSHDTWSVG